LRLWRARKRVWENERATQRSIVFFIEVVEKYCAVWGFTPVLLCTATKRINESAVIEREWSWTEIEGTCNKRVVVVVDILIL
jgi:hypothetical protein